MLNVAKHARDQCSIFSTGGKFCPDYGLLVESHALTLVTCSYALLGIVNGNVFVLAAPLTICYQLYCLCPKLLS